MLQYSYQITFLINTARCKKNKTKKKTLNPQKITCENVNLNVSSCFLQYCCKTHGGVACSYLSVGVKYRVGEGSWACFVHLGVWEKVINIEGHLAVESLLCGHSLIRGPRCHARSTASLSAWRAGQETRPGLVHSKWRNSLQFTPGRDKGIKI